MTEVEEGIINVLASQGLLQESQLQQIQQQITQGQALLDVLLQNKLIDEEQFVQAQAQVLGMSYVNLKGVGIPRDVLLIVPESTAHEHQIIPYEQTDKELRVAMVDPSDRQIVEFIHKKVDKPVAVALASRSSIQGALRLYQESLETEVQNVLATVGSISAPGEDDLSKVAEDLPIIRMVDLVLKHAILQNASDIHIEPTEKNVMIRYRIDGMLHEVMKLSCDYLAGLVARIKVLSSLKIDEHRLPQDGRFKIETDDYKIAFRVSILPVYDGEKVVMRLLDESGRGYDLDSLGMSSTILEMFQRNIDKPHGMILVTGPTGSGKTTTLYAAMKKLNTEDVNISTIEDPIEYRMPRINQTQVNPQIGLTFANGLRSLVRQDPDIIMVGEIRDQETASLAVNAALTGHLVLSTLHTNSAAGALPRLLDMKVEAFLLASTVNMLLAQRLVRKLCAECRQQIPLDQQVLTEMSKYADIERVMATLQKNGIVPQGAKWTDVKVYKAVGCPICREGYKGRFGIYEAIEFSENIRTLISPTVTSQALEDASQKEQAMLTMLEDGLVKVVTGDTTVEEVLRMAKE